MDEAQSAGGATVDECYGPVTATVELQEERPITTHHWPAVPPVGGGSYLVSFAILPILTFFLTVLLPDMFLFNTDVTLQALGENLREICNKDDPDHLTVVSGDRHGDDDEEDFLDESTHALDEIV